jgi:hypothetical protein
MYSLNLLFELTSKKECNNIVNGVIRPRYFNNNLTKKRRKELLRNLFKKKKVFWVC